MRRVKRERYIRYILVFLFIPEGEGYPKECLFEMHTYGYGIAKHCNGWID
jgi:hypothetical protein